MKLFKMVNYQLKLAAASVACLGLIGLLSPANARSPLDDGPRPVRLILGGGFTNGGDKLATAVFNDGSTQNVRAGNRFQIYIGADIRLTPMLQLGVTAGYHSDSANSGFGRVRFSRYPIEVIGYVKPLRRWRFGIGPRFALNPQLRASGDAADLAESFEPSVGGVIEVEFMAHSRQGVKLRYVVERYESSTNLPAVKGDHIALLFNWYF